MKTNNQIIVKEAVKKRKPGVLRYIVLFAALMTLLCMKGTGTALVQAAGQTAVRPAVMQVKAGKLRILYRSSNKRFYVKDANGQYLKEAGLYVITRQTAGGVTFPTSVYYVRAGGLMPNKKGIVNAAGLKVAGRDYDGSYYFNSRGRLLYSSAGLVRLSKVRSVNAELYNGYYYLDAYSRIAPEGSIRQISKGSFDGIYYFGKNGKLDTVPAVHRLDTELNDRRYKGYYCFAGTDGKLVTEKGLIKVDGEYYYVGNTYGKVVTNMEKRINGLVYTFGPDGIATVKKDTSLSALKKTLNTRIKSYDGSWSVYVKNLDSGESILINDRKYYAASLVKPFLLACLYDQEKKGKLEIGSERE